MHQRKTSISLIVLVEMYVPRHISSPHKRLSNVVLYVQKALM